MVGDHVGAYGCKGDVPFCVDVAVGVVAAPFVPEDGGANRKEDQNEHTNDDARNHRAIGRLRDSGRGVVSTVAVTCTAADAVFNPRSAAGIFAIRLDVAIQTQADVARCKRSKSAAPTAGAVDGVALIIGVCGKVSVRSGKICCSINIVIIILLPLRPLLSY